MADYNDSQRIKDIAEGLIKKHHSHLEPANISYLMKEAGDIEGKINTKGKKRKICKARKVPNIYRHLTAFDFILEVDEQSWDELSIEAQEALIDHELCRMGWDEKGAFVKDPPIVLFPAVIERHGLYTEALEAFGNSLRQLPLFKEPTPRKRAAAVN